MLVRHVVRSIRSRPGYALAVIGTLALGIGANSAIFTLLDTVLLRPLPYPESGQLAAVYQRNPRLKIEQGGFAPIRIEQLREQAKSVQGVSGFYTDTVSETSGQVPERLTVAFTSPRFFDVFRIQLAAGRWLNGEEDRVNDPQPALMISHRLWVQRFQRDPNMQGKSLRIGRTDVPVAGVLPASFSFPNSEVDLWQVASFPAPLRNNPAINFYSAITRVKADYTLEQSRAELATLLDRLDKDFTTKQPGWTLELAKLQTFGTDKYSRTLTMLFAAVGLLLLLACANVAALNLAQLEARTRELSLRTALGASHVQLTRELLIEALSLALAGAGLGLLLAQSLVSMFRQSAKEFPRIAEAQIDARVVAFTFLAAVVATLLFALLPSWRASQKAIAAGLGNRGYTSARNRSQQSLVALQFAMAIVLVAGAGLLWRSFSALSNVSMGFDTDNVSTFRITASWGESNNNTAVQERFRRTLERLRNIPGVESAAIAVSLPPTGVSVATNFKLGASPLTDFAFPYSAQSRAVSGDYFQALRIPVLQGSACRDEVVKPNAEMQVFNALVNQAFVSRYLNGVPALDQMLHAEMSNKAFYSLRIGGIVADVREEAPGIPAAPVVYTCGLPGFYPDPSFIVRTKPGSQLTNQTVREAIREVSPTRAVYGFQTLASRISESISSPRFNATLIGGFAITGLLLAAIGLYAVMNYSVSTRRREIGVRLAIGATPAQIQSQFAKRAAWIVVVGLALGLPGAIGLSRFLKSLLYEVPALDPVVFLGAPLILTIVAAVAAYRPARIAAKVDPMESMRAE